MIMKILHPPPPKIKINNKNQDCFIHYLKHSDMFKKL